LNGLRLAICIKLLKNGRVPNYCFDIIQDLGGLVIYFYISVLVISIMPTGLNYHFNTVNESNMKWIEIIKVLKGILSVDVLRISEKNEIIKLFANTRKLHFALKLSLKCLMASTFLVYVLIILFKYDFYYTIKFGLISAIVSYYVIYFASTITYYSLMYFLIICYYFLSTV